MSACGENPAVRAKSHASLRMPLTDEPTVRRIPDLRLLAAAGGESLAVVVERQSHRVHGPFESVQPPLIFCVPDLDDGRTAFVEVVIGVETRECEYRSIGAEYNPKYVT